MKILVDCSNYFSDNKNYGDLAMFVMMGRRLRSLWPGCEIRLITLDPALIERHVPDMRPLVLLKRHHWQLFSPQFFHLACKPKRWVRRLRRWKFNPASRRTRAVLRERVNREPDADMLLEELRTSDLILATGGGYFSDNFPEHACGILDTLAGGCFFGAPSVIMGAGFESVCNASLCAKARSVLPLLDFIACREGSYAPSVLRGFGVSQGLIRVIGDEAIELSFQARSPSLGQGIGVNIRQAAYSDLADEVIAGVRACLSNAAEKYATSLLPIPISMFGPSDCESIRQLLAKHAPASDGGESLDDLPKLFDQVSRCRIVVTGSYHAAVFALSQGISVVALAKSHHYVSKMSGLAAEFGPSCKVVSLTMQEWPRNLAVAIDDAWQSADQGRPELLRNAQRQIRLNEEAYRALKVVVG